MYIRQTTSKGKNYYRVVEARWVDGRSRQVNVVSLGTTPSIPDAIEAKRRRAKVMEKRRQQLRGYYPSDNALAHAPKAMAEELASISEGLTKIRAEVELLERIAPDVPPFSEGAPRVKATKVGIRPDAMVPTGPESAWHARGCWGLRPASKGGIQYEHLTFEEQLEVDPGSIHVIRALEATDLNSPEYLAECPAREQIQPGFRYMFDEEVHEYRFITEVVGPYFDDSPFLQTRFADRVRRCREIGEPSSWTACVRCDHDGYSTGYLIDRANREMRDCPECHGKGFIIPTLVMAGSH